MVTPPETGDPGHCRVPIGRSQPEEKVLAIPDIRSAQVVIPCRDLHETVAFFTVKLGFRVDLVSPADGPTTTVVSGYGVSLRLEAAGAVSPMVLRLECGRSGHPAEIVGPDGIRVLLVDEPDGLNLPDGTQEFIVSRMNAGNGWGVGRAGMLYRDLIPGRLGGRFVASHIRIPDGGDVPDYVHFHKVRFQMIFCASGWVRVVYEDQGPPFVLNAGDCVLQPPEIRHRVLEASPGLEVVEIGCPAIHDTLADHDLALPTGLVRPERDFGGQRFVRHVAALAKCHPTDNGLFEVQDTGIGRATGGLAGVRVMRTTGQSGVRAARRHSGEFFFLFVLKGRLDFESVRHGSHRFEQGDACVIPSGADFELGATEPVEVLEVTLPA